MFSHTLLLFLIINSGFFSECGAFLRGNDSKLSSSTDRQIISHIFRESIPQISSRNDIFSRVRANSANVHEVVFVIVPRNMDQLTSILYDLSDPLSSNYGRHWTRDRIVELTSNPESHHAVISYLQRNGIAFISETAGGEYVTASASVAVWERIFNTEFFIFHQLHSDGQVEKLIRAERYWIPIELDSHVESVFKTIQMPVISSGSLSILSPQLSPYSAASLSTSTLPLDSLSVLKSESEGSGLHLLMEVESLRSNKSSKLTLDRMKSITILDAVITPAKIKSYYNMSASVAGSSKSTQAVFAAIKQYMSPADLQFFQTDQGLPAQAISSSIGDFVSNAACLSDPTNCAEGNLDTQYIMGISGRSPTTYWYSDLSFSDWLVTVADTVNPPLVFSISYGQEESYTSASELNAFSTQAIKLGAMGVTILVASGDDGANSRSVRTSGVLACGYTPEYPASSPYVTAVGATSGPESGGVEVVCQGSTHSITSGGGFSSFYDVPVYQTAAVSGYFTAAAAAGHKLVAGYSQGRGYPDVTLAGYNYYTRIGGKYYTVSGTSASCPVVAGMISNINAARLAKNKGSVGWLNPTLYSNYGSFTNDITSGKIHCVATGTCCTQGFWATPGWDPASGLGSLNYGKLETLLVSLGQVNTLAGIPTDPPVLSPKSKAAFNSDDYYATIIGAVVGGLVLIAGIAVTYVLCIGHIRPPETAIESPATSIGEVYDCNMNSEFGDLIATPARAHFSPPCSPIVSVHPMVMRFPK